MLTPHCPPHHHALPAVTALWTERERERQSTALEPARQVSARQYASQVGREVGDVGLLSLTLATSLVLPPGEETSRRERRQIQKEARRQQGARGQERREHLLSRREHLVKQLVRPRHGTGAHGSRACSRAPVSLAQASISRLSEGTRTRAGHERHARYLQHHAHLEGLHSPVRVCHVHSLLSTPPTRQG